MLKRLSVLIATLVYLFGATSEAQVYCDNFDAVSVPQSNKRDAFNIYGNGNTGFLQKWFIPSGTPSIQATGDFAGVTAYEGNQYALIGVCDVSRTFTDGLLLDYNFVQGQNYTISVVNRNMPIGSSQPTPIDVDYILLQTLIPYTYNPNTGCSNTPPIPTTGSFVFHTIPSYDQNSWQLFTFNTGALTSNYTYLWIRPKFTSSSPSITTALLMDSFCVQPSCQLSVNLGNDTSICLGQTVTIGAPINGADYTWNTGSNDSIITVSASGTYWVNVSLNSCIGTDTIQVLASPSANLYLGPDTNLCLGQLLVLDATTPGGSYLWNDSSTNSTLSIANAGIYSVTVSVINFCPASDSVSVTYSRQPPVIDLVSDSTLCGNYGLIKLNLGNDVNYLWSDGTTESVIVIENSGVYSVTVSNGCGSVTDATNFSLISDECIMSVPTAFSPNGDGANDIFRAISRCGTSKFHMNIFNRWGELVFETGTITEGWNGIYKGIPQPLGVFIFTIEYFNDCEHKLKKFVGNVTLVR